MPVRCAAAILSGSGPHSPFAALHKFVSFRGFFCRAFGGAEPADRDPIVWTGRALQAESAERE
jgi:hypothetical protein